MRKLLFMTLLLLPLVSHAYIGPGMGASALGVIFGTLGAIFLGLVAIIWYPFKRLIARFRKKKVVTADKDPGTG